ncbi:hypothetical protein QWJ46_17105 [Rhizobium sp. CBN3]|uniref:hypothetical protein n=1 Tax=Rhizobium sp. CBN3 TaxID=3058045 RepID=UPI0026740966|nr:hypothetical protein [Rhizobium sp. CBN3]MDO3434399.1 hypothetical protein [Rhizobium sp. CBN3]
MRHSYIYDALQQFLQGVRLKNVHKIVCIKNNQMPQFRARGEVDHHRAVSAGRVRRRSFARVSFVAHLCRKNNAAAGRKSKEHAFGYRGI